MGHGEVEGGGGRCRWGHACKPLRRMSSSWGPCSTTLPLDSTAIWSASRMVESLGHRGAQGWTQSRTQGDRIVLGM